MVTFDQIVTAILIKATAGLTTYSEFVGVAIRRLIQHYAVSSGFLNFAHMSEVFLAESDGRS